VLALSGRNDQPPAAAAALVKPNTAAREAAFKQPCANLLLCDVINVTLNCVFILRAPAVTR
jgi:hypothetical protein